MNRGEMTTELRTRIGNPTAGDVADSVLHTQLNAAHRDIVTKYNHQKSRKICDFDTIVDQTSYGLPTDCSALLYVTDIENNNPLKKGGHRQYNDVIFTDATSAKPLRYYRLRDFIHLDPPPDGVYTIRLIYIESIADFADDNAEPVIGDEWHLGIVFLARWYYFDSAFDLPKAGYALNAWRTWFSDRPTDKEQEIEALDQGVELPTLTTSTPRQDFDRSL